MKKKLFLFYSAIIFILLLIAGCNIGISSDTKTIDPTDPVTFPTAEESAKLLPETVENTTKLDVPELPGVSDTDEVYGLSKAPLYTNLGIVRRDKVDTNGNLLTTDTFSYGDYWNGTYDSKILSTASTSNGSTYSYEYDSDGKISKVSLTASYYTRSYNYYRDSDGKITGILINTNNGSSYVYRSIVYNDDGYQEITYNYDGSNWNAYTGSVLVKTNTVFTLYLYHFYTGSTVYRGRYEYAVINKNYLSIYQRLLISADGTILSGNTYTYESGTYTEINTYFRFNSSTNTWTHVNTTYYYIEYLTYSNWSTREAGDSTRFAFFELFN